ncbi:hypothetical protein [Actinomadura logoneensis]|uniref:hypothetical protein n=1 Tax=Actinomadura logoneensis TaxID=2293572 RepID=UPI001314BE4A|nr:hypothetical protein [Actinomadura logoneensis]
MHRAGEMGLEGGHKLRDACWGMLGERTRARLAELAGPTLDWYAAEDSADPGRRPKALVLGQDGLAVAEPRLSTEHRPVYVISAFQFAPGSLRHVRVGHRPGPMDAARTGGPGPGASPAGPPSGGGADLGLTAQARGVLGNLPPRAQELLQAPFTSGSPPLRCDWHYEGFEHHLKVFLFCLAGAHHVTVATGSRIVPAGHSAESAHWDLTCYRAAVRRRIGR